jgi:rubrerythrin
MTGDDTSLTVGGIERLLNRRSVLKTAAASAVAATLFSGSAAATNADRINFCDCSQICVERPDDDKGLYYAVTAERVRGNWEFGRIRFGARAGSKCEDVEGTEKKIVALVPQVNPDDLAYCNPNQCARKAVDVYLDEHDLACRNEVDGEPAFGTFDDIKPSENNTTIEIVRGRCDDPDDGEDGDGDEEVTDVDVLNYALTLEHLEYAFYRDGLEEFGEGAFTDAGFPSDAGSNLADVRDHEKTHVDTLTAVIEDLGGDPVEEACYEFGYQNPAEFVAIAKMLENTGVSAYDGAISLIESGDLQTAGATIATVEARHAAYLNDLDGEDPFPAAFDDPKTMAEVLAAAGGFIVDCE